METGPFSEPNPGDTHRSSDWQIRVNSTGEVVWRADGLTTTSGKVHVHFGDGRFVGSLTGKSELLPDTEYRLRVRHRDSSGATNNVSAWSERFFRTTRAITPLPSAPDWHVAANAGHFAFLAPCPPALVEAMPAICRDAAGFDRVAFHQTFNAQVLAFFQRHIVAARAP